MIDWNRITELESEVGEEDFAEVIEMFFEEVEEVLSRLGSSTPKSLAQDLHFLKGSALNIGMVRVSDLCRYGEACLRQVPPAIVDIDTIRAAFLETKAEFEALAAA